MHHATPPRPSESRAIAAPTDWTGGSVGTERYGARRGPKWGALTVVALLHVALLTLTLTGRVTIDRPVTPPSLATFDVMPPAPVSPPVVDTPGEVAAPSPVPAIVAPAPVSITPVPIVPVIAPAPIVTTPVARAPIVTGPPVAAAPARTAPSAVPAPPSAITPPVFDAAQLDNPAPAYPFAARKAREQGVVTLRVLVTDQGRAGTVEIAESSGSSRLDTAARETVKRWRFLPARAGAQAVAASVLVPVTFRLG